MSGLTKIAKKQKKIEVDGKEYTLTQLNLADMAEIHKFAEEKYFSDMKQRLNVLPPDCLQFKTLADKIVEVKRNDLIPELIQYSSGTEASLLQLFLMLKHEHPDITRKEVNNLAMSFNDFLDVAEDLSKKGGNSNPPAREGN